MPSEAAPAASSEPAYADAGPTIPATISLAPGEVLSIGVDDIERVAIGDPKVLDMTIVSPTEILVQAQTVGTTNLIVWDHQGKHTSQIDVIDRASQAVEEHLQQMLQELQLPAVQVRRERELLFLIGEVPRKEDLDTLERLLSAYSIPITNLVTVVPTAAQPATSSGPPPPSVQLTVQLIEVTRDNADKLGVDWSDAVTFTETPFSALGNETSRIERINEAFRIGAFSRTAKGGPLSATLSLLASQGKARILAEPKLVASSGKEATAFLGVQVPTLSTSSVSSGAVSQSIELHDTGVTLKFRPVVLPDASSIQLGVEVEVSSVDVGSAIEVQGTSVKGFRSRKTKTEVVTGNGQSVLISGLLTENETKSLHQVPAIGSIPVFGHLFRSTEFERKRTELIVVITPDILVQGQAEATFDRIVAQEQALTAAETADAIEDPILRYALTVQQRIAKSLQYPDRERALGTDAQVKLRVHLLRDGTLQQAAIAESSGFETFDQAAVKAAKSQSPFPMFPADLVQPDLWLELPVLFRS